MKLLVTSSSIVSWIPNGRPRTAQACTVPGHQIGLAIPDAWYEWSEEEERQEEVSFWKGPKTSSQAMLLPSSSPFPDHRHLSNLISPKVTIATIEFNRSLEGMNCSFDHTGVTVYLHGDWRLEGFIRAVGTYSRKWLGICMHLGDPKWYHQRFASELGNDNLWLQLGITQLVDLQTQNLEHSNSKCVKSLMPKDRRRPVGPLQCQIILEQEIRRLRRQEMRLSRPKLMEHAPLPAFRG